MTNTNVSHRESKPSGKVGRPTARRTSGDESSNDNIDRDTRSETAQDGSSDGDKTAEGVAHVQVAAGGDTEFRKIFA
jgi:hypothetical protein